MKEFLWRKFVKDYENYKDPEVRGRYTKLTGTLGIIVNSVLCVFKIILGFTINSIAVIADGFHDLADSLAACITLIAVRIARMPADKGHPYGHARAEYLASLLVSVIVLIVGYQMLKSSIEECRHPEPTEFSWLMVGFMIFAILFKGSQALFTIATGKHIHSLPVIAAGTDNRNDVITSIIIVAGMLIDYFAGIDLDGYLGGLVSLFILFTGIQLIRETINPLLGDPPDQEKVEEIERIILSQPEVLGMHDLVLYNYGPGRSFASFHAEVDASGDLVETHNVIDKIERQLQQKLNINAAGHMDPVDIDDPVIRRLRCVIANAIQGIDGVDGFHDLRIIPKERKEGIQMNVVFDVVCTPGRNVDIDEIGEQLTEVIKNENEGYGVLIRYDRLYT